MFNGLIQFKFQNDGTYRLAIRRVSLATGQSTDAAVHHRRPSAAPDSVAGRRSLSSRPRWCRTVVGSCDPVSAVDRNLPKIKQKLVEAPAHPTLSFKLAQLLTQLVRLVAGKVGNTGPRVLGGCAEQFEYLVQLVVGITYSRKRRHSGHHLHEDAAHAPHVQRGWVLGAAQQDIWNGTERNEHELG